MDKIIKSITDPKTGMLAKLNCKFMKKELRMINNSLCVELVPVIANMTSVMFGITVFLIIG